jgi:predicted DNA-binding transcriptional regulator AlpA
MKPKLKRVPEVAKALGISTAYTYVLSSTDSDFPPVAERVGVVNFYRTADVARYAQTRKSRRRWGNINFG